MKRLVYGCILLLAATLVIGHWIINPTPIMPDWAYYIAIPFALLTGHRGIEIIEKELEI